VDLAAHCQHRNSIAEFDGAADRIFEKQPLTPYPQRAVILLRSRRDITPLSGIARHYWRPPWSEATMARRNQRGTRRTARRQHVNVGFTHSSLASADNLWVSGVDEL